MSRIATTVRNSGRRTVLRGVQYCCFSDIVMLPVAERRSTSVIRRRIVLPSMAKTMFMSVKTTEGESSDPFRANVETDYPRDLFPRDTCTNVRCSLLGVALLVCMARIGKY